MISDGFPLHQYKGKGDLPQLLEQKVPGTMTGCTLRLRASCATSLPGWSSGGEGEVGV